MMHANRSRHAAARGFTLIEVVVAVAVTALMGGMVTVAFDSAFHAKRTVESEADYYRMLRSALDRMAREVSAAYVSDRYDVTRYRDQNDRPSNFIGESDSLTFTSLAHQRLYTDAKTSDEMVVQYSLQTGVDPDAPDRRDLVRREKSIVQGPIDQGGRKDVLFENAERIQFQYWDSKQKEWEDEWDTRQPERQNILPTRVKITLTAKDENGKDRQYSIETRIMLNTAMPRY